VLPETGCNEATSSNEGMGIDTDWMAGVSLPLKAIVSIIVVIITVPVRRIRCSQVEIETTTPSLPVHA